MSDIILLIDVLVPCPHMSLLRSYAMTVTPVCVHTGMFVCTALVWTAAGVFQ